MSLLGVVLAGGESRRFGSAKALARLHGRPLWQIVSRTLADAVDRVVAVVNDPEVAASIDLEQKADVRPGLGPLAGVETALEWAKLEGRDGALVVACDMPWVEPECLAALAKAWTGRSIVAPRSEGPWGFEPACAAFPTAVAEEVRQALSAGQYELGSFTASRRPTLVEVPAVRGSSFRSVNEPSDLPPPAVSVIGNKKSGKTTLAVSLIAELAKRGRRVMSAKHGHHFRLDTEGTDSWKHRHEGCAERVLLAGPDEFAVMGSWPGEEPTLDELLALHLRGAEVVVVEGFRTAPVPKIEIYRSDAQPEPILHPAGAKDAGALAAVTDRPDLGWSVPVFDPDDPDLAVRLADLVEGVLLP